MAQPSTLDREVMFPKLTEAQISRLMPLGVQHHFGQDEIIFESGGAGIAKFSVILKGRLQVVSPSAAGEVPVTTAEEGDFTGEVDMLSGRHSLVRARAATDCELLEIDQKDLRRIVQTDAELSEIFLRAFVRRRANLIANSTGGLVLLGSAHSADTLRLKEFLSRNGRRHTLRVPRRRAGLRSAGVVRTLRHQPGPDSRGDLRPARRAEQSDQCPPRRLPRLQESDIGLRANSRLDRGRRG